MRTVTTSGEWDTETYQIVSGKVCVNPQKKRSKGITVLIIVLSYYMSIIGITRQRYVHLAILTNLCYNYCILKAW